MPKLRLPRRVKQPKPRRSRRSFPAHRAWVRSHECCVPGCTAQPIECAHVRSGTDGGTALKPSDRWVISLCGHHHAEQHVMGEGAFQEKYQLDLLALAEEFARCSPHRLRWEELAQ